VRFAPGYEVLPLTSRSLPPPVPTNTILVGCKRFIAIDPGAETDTGRRHLIDAIARRREMGDELLAVVLTHHHPDHVAAVDAVRERFAAPLWAHGLCGELLRMRLDRALDDAAVIDLGAGPDGRDGWRLEAVHTPGHAADHLALHDARHRAMVIGDLVSTAVSVYVGYPGGDLRLYLASIERVRRLDLRVLYPAHGTPSRDPAKLFERTIEHRRERIEQAARVLADENGEAVAAGALAARIYPQLTGFAVELGLRATRAALRYLAEEGRIEQVGDDSYRAL
jgi:glyoxylase-like metal-dependent hydrolase (beta-lactamase superfamily II)